MRAQDGPGWRGEPGTAASVSCEAQAQRAARRGLVDRRSVLLYLATGVAGFLVDFGLLVFFREVVGVPVWLATTIGFWVSLGVVFLTNKYVTFESPNQTHIQLIKYFALLGVNYLVTLGIVGFGVWVGVGYQVGKVVAVGLIAVWNYLLYRMWIFR